MTDLGSPARYSVFTASGISLNMLQDKEITVVEALGAPEAVLGSLTDMSLLLMDDEGSNLRFESLSAHLLNLFDARRAVPESLPTPPLLLYLESPRKCFLAWKRC